MSRIEFQAPFFKRTVARDFFGLGVGILYHMCGPVQGKKDLIFFFVFARIFDDSPVSATVGIKKTIDYCAIIILLFNR
jgi:hypothetical protein